MGKLSVRRRSPLVNVALSAIMAALVAAATYAVQVPVPATNGYINVGDAMIFTSSLVFGPIVGGVAGGLGSSLSDAFGGYWQFVPITLAVKGLEGLAAGLIANGRSTKRDLLAVLIGGLIMVSGYFLAETYLLGYGAAAALVELPGNIFQTGAGALIGIPAAIAVRRYVGSLR